MVELFAQVWLLCAIAFVAGSAVTWLLFVRRPRRRPARTPAATPWPPRRPARRPRHLRAEPPAPPPPAAEPALANLDTHRADPARRPGATAAGALDRLGVAPPRTTPQPAPIPVQGGPVDEPASRGGEGG